MYERKLIDYLPPILRDVEEYKAILDDTETSLLWESTEKALNDQFIETATEYGVERLEKTLKIKPKGNLTLDERKFTILTKLNEELPYTLIVLENMLESLCGKGNYEININYNDYFVKVLIGLNVENMYDDVVKLVHRIIPANMVIQCIIKYMQHKQLSQFTHKQLSQFTHKQIRYNEVMNE